VREDKPSSCFVFVLIYRKKTCVISDIAAACLLLSYITSLIGATPLKLKERTLALLSPRQNGNDQLVAEKKERQRRDVETDPHAVK
jgi:hypothetical protein